MSKDKKEKFDKSDKFDKQIAKQQALEAIGAIMRTVMREELTTPIRPSVAFALDADGKTYTQLHLDEHKAVVASLDEHSVDVLRDMVRDEVSGIVEDALLQFRQELQEQTAKLVKDEIYSLAVLNGWVTYAPNVTTLKPKKTAQKEQ